jgi:S-DNA-T family DNA segregation ATPase FtsK/SpoIIIE
VEVVIREGRGSVSLLQRALGIGYGRAARLIDFMEEDGIVGAYNGSKSRDVVMTMDQWSRMQTGTESADEIAQAIISPAVRPTPIKAPAVSTGRVTKLSAASPSAAVPEKKASKAAPTETKEAKKSRKDPTVPFPVDPSPNDFDDDSEAELESEDDRFDDEENFEDEDAEAVDLHEFTGDDDLEYEDVDDDDDVDPEEDE